MAKKELDVVEDLDILTFSCPDVLAIRKKNYGS
jgi:hypothetical protein